MFTVVPFISSTGLAIVAEASLRCADFVRKKLSSQYWLFFFLFGPDYQKFLVFENLKDRAAFLGLIMLCLLDNGTWECLIFHFGFFFCGITIFYVSISDAVFLVTSYSIFDHSVWLTLSF